MKSILQSTNDSSVLAIKTTKSIENLVVGQVESFFKVFGHVLVKVYK